MALREHYNAPFISAPDTHKRNNSHLTARCLSISGEGLISLRQSAFNNYFWYVVPLHMSMHTAL